MAAFIPRQHHSEKQRLRFFNARRKENYSAGIFLALGLKTYLALGRDRLFDQLADGLKDFLNIGIAALDLSIVADIFGLQRFKLLGQVIVCGKNLLDAHESAHNGNVDEGCTMASEDTREHGNALFRKGARPGAPSATTVCSYKSQGQRVSFLACQLKDEIIREPIAPNSQVEVTSGDAVRPGKIAIAHDFLASDQVNPRFDGLQRNNGLITSSNDQGFGFLRHSDLRLYQHNTRDRSFQPPLPVSPPYRTDEYLRRTR